MLLLFLLLSLLLALPMWSTILSFENDAKQV
jgi:hypothetical protein